MAVSSQVSAVGSRCDLSTILIDRVRFVHISCNIVPQGGNHSLPCRSGTTCGRAGPPFFHLVWTTFFHLRTTYDFRLVATLTPYQWDLRATLRYEVLK